MNFEKRVTFTLTKEEKVEIVQSLVREYEMALNALNHRPFNSLKEEEKENIMSLHSIFGGLEERWKKAVESQQLMKTQK